MALNSDLQKLYVDGLITLFELDARALGAGILRFHGHIALSRLGTHLQSDWFECLDG